MTPYTWLVVLLLLSAFITKGNVKGNKKFLIIVFLLLFTFIGLRDVNTVGADSSGTDGSYPIIYEKTGETNWEELVEKGEGNYNIGFTYLMKIIYDLTNGDYQKFIIIISLFVVFSYTRFIRKYSPSPIQSVLYFLGLLYFTLLYNALKQAMAMSVLLYAFDAIIEKKPVKYVFLVLIAVQFHFPALVFLPAYWIGRMKIGTSFLLLLAGLLLVTFLLRDQLLNMMLDAYSSDEIEGSMEGVRFLRNKSIVMIVIVVAAVVLRPPTEGDTVYNASLIFAGIAIVLQTFCGYSNIFERLADYYFHTSIIFIPLIFENCKLKKHMIKVETESKIKTAAPILFCAFAIWRFLSMVNNSPEFMALRFIWQG